MWRSPRRAPGGPPEVEGVLAFGYQKEVAKLPSLTVFCYVRNAHVGLPVIICQNKTRFSRDSDRYIILAHF